MGLLLDFKKLLLTMRKYWVFIACCTILATTASGVAILREPVLYQTTGILYINPLVKGLYTNSGWMTSYMRSDTMLEPLAKKYSLGIDLIRNELRIQFNEDTNEYNIQLTSAHPQEASEMVDKIMLRILEDANKSFNEKELIKEKEELEANKQSCEKEINSLLNDRKLLDQSLKAPSTERAIRMQDNLLLIQVMNAELDEIETKSKEVQNKINGYKESQIIIKSENNIERVHYPKYSKVIVTLMVILLFSVLASCLYEFFKYNGESKKYENSSNR